MAEIKEFYSDSPRVSQKEAQVFGPEIERLAEANGGEVTAWHILDAARNPASPLHPKFTWDDEAAAEQYRLQEARGIVDAVKVRIIRVDGELLSDGPVVINIKRKEPIRIQENGREYNLNPYVLTTVLQNRPDDQDTAIEEAKRMLLAFRRRLGTLQNLFGDRYPSVQTVIRGLEEFAKEVDEESAGVAIA